MRRRNQRLRRLLLPKNALMVLNELVGNTPFNVIEGDAASEGNFKCCVVINGKEHVGIGECLFLRTNTDLILRSIWCQHYKHGCLEKCVFKS